MPAALVAVDEIQQGVPGFKAVGVAINVGDAVVGKRDAHE